MAARKPKGELVKCDVCKKSFVKGYISVHRRRVHGIASSRGKKQLVAVNNHKAAFQQADGFILLEDQDGNIWIAEQIK